MSKGTPSMGRRQKKVHIRCRRCGSVSYHKTKKVCTACGFGKSRRMRDYKWKEKG